MSALYGVNATKRNAVPQELSNYGEVGGKVLMAFDSITPSAALGATDTIEMCKLPKNARVVGGYLKFAAQGGSCTLDIGHNAGDESLETADPDSLGTAIDVSSAGLVLLSAENAAKFGEKMNDHVTISLALSAAGANANAKIDLCILYVLV